MKDSTMVALQKAVLPWAKENMPEQYEATLRVAGKPASFKAYLLRLLEIRYERDVENRGELPILALDETSLTIGATIKGVGHYEFQGKRAVKGGGSRVRAISELAMDPEEWKQMEAARAAFDLEYEKE
jgi:hypothetical protein